MNSFDLFDTLVAAPDRARPAGDQDRHFPIAENIPKVQPDDIIVSDYYDREKAERIVREVCGLSNELFVTEAGKASGEIWRELRKKDYVIESHTGDHPVTDVASPQRAGIPATLTSLAKQTSSEKELSANGNDSIARVVREARLRTWNADPTLRGLQLHQIERNFPFLLKVAYELDKIMREQEQWDCKKCGVSHHPRYERLLLCSRDCYLLTALMRWGQKTGVFGSYEIHYFLNSRVTRYRPSDDYGRYARRLVDFRALIVDMCGSGNSLKFFCDKFGGTPLLVVSNQDNVEHLVHGGIRETSNPAPHESVVDVPCSLSENLKPEIDTMLVAFAKCVETGLPEPTYSLAWALRRIEDPRTQCLWADHLADCKATYDLLNSGPLPHPVIL